MRRETSARPPRAEAFRKPSAPPVITQCYPRVCVSTVYARVCACGEQPLSSLFLFAGRERYSCMRYKRLTSFLTSRVDKTIATASKRGRIVARKYATKCCDTHWRLHAKHVTTLGQGGSCPPRWMLCPPPQTSHLQLLFLHINFPSPVSLDAQM